MNKVALGMTDALLLNEIVFMSNGCMIVKLKDATKTQHTSFALLHNQGDVNKIK